MVTAAEAAVILGISAASVRNWVKQGLLTQCSAGIPEEEVHILKERISAGELNRLNRRANKKKAGGTSPVKHKYAGLSRSLLASGGSSGMIIWLIVLNLLRTHGLVSSKNLTELSKLEPGDFCSEALLQHMKSGYKSQRITPGSRGFGNVIKTLEAFDFERLEPAVEDVAGIIYQSLKQAGARAVSGSFYTPPELALSLVESSMSFSGTAESAQRFLDPCCGSGQFLLSFIKAGGSVRNIRGIDSDNTAVFTAASNIFIQCPATDFMPDICCADGLEYEDPDAPPTPADIFDIAVTNPPWGAVVPAARQKLAAQYPEITSGESFSYFISRCIRATGSEGIVSFVLPESITNVRRHDDIRNHILRSCAIKRIDSHGRIFKDVFTPVITMELQKKKIDARPAAGQGWKRQLEFNININSKDVRIIDSIYALPHTTLKGMADWALGIVTGDNDRFLRSTAGDGYEPVIRGCDVLPGRVTEPEIYIRFEPERLQQTAPVEKYRSPEKIVYRFISKRMVFANEPSGILTLNSANILIPDTEKLAKAGFRPDEIAGLFNSDLYSFIHQKRFNSIKVLRSHLEELPLPENPEDIFRKLNSSDLQYIADSV